MSWSAQQSAVFEEVQNGTLHLVVVSTAGSGKTALLRGIAEHLPKQTRVLYAAFNKAIAQKTQELFADAKLPVEAKTFNSIGMGTFRINNHCPRVDTNKYHSLVRTQLAGHGIRGKRLIELSSAMTKICNLVRLTLTDSQNPAKVSQLCEHYEMDDLLSEDKVFHDVLVAVLDRGLDLALSPASPTIDFIDQLYIPVKEDFETDLYDIILVDEVQDVSNASRELLMKHLAPNGRMICVGDKSQAIMAFAGANVNSIEDLVARLEAKEMPLSVCWRCPTSHIALAKELDPTIESATGAIEGTVGEFSEKDLVARVPNKALILCRTNAPLVDACFRFIRSGRVARIRGRDIGERLKAMAKKVCRKPTTNFAVEFVPRLETWRQKEETRMEDSTEEAKVAFTDRVDTLRAIFESLPKTPASLRDLETEIDRLFVDDIEDAVILSTIHKAKGLENDVVCLLHPHLLPHPMVKHPDGLKQERNLKFVAVTRSKRELYFVHKQDETSKKRKRA